MSDEKPKKVTLKELMDNPTPENKAQLKRLNEQLSAMVQKPVFEQAKAVTAALQKQQESLANMFPQSVLEALAKSVKPLANLPKIEIPRFDFPPIEPSFSSAKAMASVHEAARAKIEREAELYDAQMDQKTLLEEQVEHIQKMVEQQTLTQKAINALLDYTTNRDIQQSKTERLNLRVTILTFVVSVAALMITTMQVFSGPPSVTVNPQISLDSIAPVLERIETSSKKDRELIHQLLQKIESRTEKMRTRPQ